MLKQFLSQFDPTNKSIAELGQMVYGENVLLYDLRTETHQPTKTKLKKNLPSRSLKKKLQPNFLSGL